MMALIASAWGSLDEKDDRAATGVVADALAPLCVASGDPARMGLYLASMNAGAATAVRFWAQAGRHGIAFASPELFPWTLANGPCALLARRFRTMGPNATFTGRVGALRAALTHACDDLGGGLIDTAWVVAIDFATSDRPQGSYAAVRLAPPSAESRQPALSTTASCGDDDTLPASLALAAFIERGHRSAGTGRVAGSVE
jgi:hypothetical protein